MNWFWNRSKESEVEGRLRSERPAPRPEFLRAVANRVEARRPRTSLGLRLAFASALTLTMLVAVASVGGVSYAANGAKNAVVSVGEVLSVSSNGVSAQAADNQYMKDCKEAVHQDRKAEQELHKANMQAADTQAERDAENARHAAAMQALAEREQECKDAEG